MKIAVGLTENNFNSKISEFFGRSPYFLIAEINNKKVKKIKIIENKSLDKVGGAGIFAAQLLVEKGVKLVITSNIGPRALEVLKQFKINTIAGSGTADEALQQFINKN